MLHTTTLGFHHGTGDIIPDGTDHGDQLHGMFMIHTGFHTDLTTQFATGTGLGSPQGFTDHIAQLR